MKRRDVGSKLFFLLGLAAGFGGFMLFLGRLGVWRRRERDVLRELMGLDIDQFFSPLTYKDMRVLVPSLPVNVYKCSYCQAYVPADDLANPTAAIHRHIATIHGLSPSGMRYRVITNVDEIRRRVDPDLPVILRCNLCEASLARPTREDLARHLYKVHRQALATRT